MRLDGRKNNQSVKSASSILHLEVKVRILSLLEGNNTWRETNTHTDIQTHTGNLYIFKKGIGN